MSAHYPDPPIRFRLTAPGEEVTPASEDVLVFDRPENAWKEAARRVLTAPDEPADGERVAVAAMLLDCDDAGTYHGWVVSRWAVTTTHAVVGGHSMSKNWTGALHLTGGGQLDGTFAMLGTTMIVDLIEEDWFGVDLALSTPVNGHAALVVGVAVSVTPGGTITFADGYQVEVDNCHAIAAMYR